MQGRRQGFGLVLASRVLVVFPLLGLGCGGSSMPSPHLADGSLTSYPDGGAHSDGGNISTDGMGAPGCILPAAPTDLCSALPTGKVVPCSQDGGQPSQTGY